MQLSKGLCCGGRDSVSGRFLVILCCADHDLLKEVSVCDGEFRRDLTQTSWWMFSALVPALFKLAPRFNWCTLFKSYCRSQFQAPSLALWETFEALEKTRCERCKAAFKK